MLFIFVKIAVFPLRLPAGGLIGPDHRAWPARCLRFATIGLDYIVRGGRNRKVYADDLVTGGLFSHCRNPLYVGNYLILVGVGVASCSQIFLFVVLPLMALAYWAIIAAEENFLRNKFGPDFDAYCVRVSRLFFNPVGLRSTLKGMKFHWARVVVKEYGTTFSWTAGYILVVMQNSFLMWDYDTSSPLTILLWMALAGVVVCYAVTRFLKKREIIRG